jgi:response regulator RpfG family c-di-GMP phosphodiesterase
MDSILFIHPDADIRKRVLRESTGRALTAENMVQGLRLIASQETPISGIYFNPSDTSYSSLRFIELSLLQRPVTPVHIVHDEINFESPNIHQLLKRHHIRQGFRDESSFSTLTQGLKSQSVQTKARHSSRNLPTIAQYITVPVTDFSSLYTYPFNIFIQNADNSFSLFASAGSTVDAEYLKKAAEHGPWLYVSESEIRDLRTQIHSSQKTFLHTDEFPNAWKTAEVLFKSKAIISEIRKNGASETLLDHSLELLSDVFLLVSTIAAEPGNNGINALLKRAKESGTAIAAMTLSVLMCKGLKFEKDAVIEILGIAALLQDSSLYQSPFGDLSTIPLRQLSPEARAYYLQHPIMSANLVTQNASVPDVTLQVIRQQHERKDKSGYPNRIGGSQLHPMAEVLSLINSYLDISQNSIEVTEAIASKLQEEVFPHYSDRVVQTLSEILNLKKYHAKL